ncbi:MAG TPA: ATP-binding protein, partial [Bacteroidia bacterium]|nr:ATP-binding protein [Bacteroidia bacterium]
MIEAIGFFIDKLWSLGSEKIPKTELYKKLNRKWNLTDAKENDFAVHYTDTVVEFWYKDKPKELIQFLKDKDVITIFYNKIYLEGKDFNKDIAHKIDALKVGDDIRNAGIDVFKEIEEFWIVFNQHVYESRSVKEIEDHNLIVDITNKIDGLSRIVSELKQENRKPEEISQSALDGLKDLLNQVLQGEKHINSITVEGNGNIILQDTHAVNIDIGEIPYDIIRERLSKGFGDELKLYNKVFIFCNPADESITQQYIINKLHEENIPVHVDFRGFKVEDFSYWLKTVTECRKTLIISSKNLTSGDIYFLEGVTKSLYAENIQRKFQILQFAENTALKFLQLLPLDLSNAKTLNQNLQLLTNQLKTEFGMKSDKPVFASLSPEHIDLTRMPYGGELVNLFGREKELKLLDTLWEKQNKNIVCFTADGGVGKSALVNRWLSDMKTDNFRGAKRVLAWSFYSQGTGERVTSADRFIDFSLQWFGDPNPNEGSAYDKGKRLAKLINRQPTLLILDGLEPLQIYNQVEKGKLKDPALASLLRMLAIGNNGLCMITTRLQVTGLERYKNNIHFENLELISSEAGRTILRMTDVKGEDHALEEAVSNFGNHALAINLLAKYLYKQPGHHISYIPHTESVAHLSPPRRIIEAFYQYLLSTGKTAETELLLLSGLFDRPFEQETILVLINPDIIFEGLPKTKNVTKDPAILEMMKKLDVKYKNDLVTRLSEYLNGPDDDLARKYIQMVKSDKGVDEPIEYPKLTTPLKHLTLNNFHITLNNLRNVGLFYPASKHNETEIDSHPLIREHFADKLNAEYPELYRQANLTFYEYYKALPEKLYGKYLPDTLEEMEPLFMAVTHGCKAGIHQEVFYSVYWERIDRKNKFYSTNQLGAFGSDLACLSNFFENLWGKPVENITKSEKAMVLSWAGFRLHALGRLIEASEPMKASLQICIKQDEWKKAAANASNISQIYLTAGEVHNAVKYGQQAVEYADKSEDDFQKESKRCTYADALHQAGDYKQAASLFAEAETMQKKDNINHYPIL